MKTQNIIISGQNFSLHPYKALFWKEQSALILADIHLGKAAHFRKSGIPIPASVHNSDYQRLDYLIQFYHPKNIFILGDLFHSDLNGDWDVFNGWLNNQRLTNVLLVKGNHDILHHEFYSSMEVKEKLLLGPFAFTHKPDESAGELYNIYGHVHPSVIVRSGARQSMRVSCFYFGEKEGILPSFGSFTGNSKISVKFEDRVYLIIEEKILPFNNIGISA